jgi:hypothetical protein
VASISDKQIANSVAVLELVQPMVEWPAGIRVSRGFAIQFRFQVGNERVQGGFVRPRHTWQAHGAAAKLLPYFFPQFHARPNVIGVRSVQRQPSGLQPIVEAGNSISLQKILRISKPVQEVAQVQLGGWRPLVCVPAGSPQESSAPLGLLRPAMPTSMSDTTIACARYLAFRLSNYVLLCAKRSIMNHAILLL